MASNADLLREAAALMRQRAQAAAPGPWGGTQPEIDGLYAGRCTVVRDATGRRLVSVGQTRPHDWRHAEANVEHVASWHPAVAFAVADWLDAQAQLRDELLTPAQRAAGDRIACDPQALAVARTYLGRDGG